MNKLETCCHCGELISDHTNDDLRKCYAEWSYIMTLEGVEDEE